MPQSILQMVQNAEMELGLPAATSVFGQNGTPANTDTQLGALANRVLDELRRWNRWTALQFEYDIVVTPVITTTGNMVAQSPVITNIPSTAGISAWSFACQGPGVPAAARGQAAGARRVAGQGDVRRGDDPRLVVAAGLQCRGEDGRRARRGRHRREGRQARGRQLQGARLDPGRGQHLPGANSFRRLACLLQRRRSSEQR